MSTLQEFLNANPVDGVTADIAVSTRFKDKDGNLLKFTIKAMTNEEFEAVRKRCMVIKKKGSIEFDSQKFNLAVVVNHTINPDFKNAESIKKLGCTTPEQYVERVLLAGEIAELTSQIQKLSGFDQEINDLVEEAKN